MCVAAGRSTCYLEVRQRLELAHFRLQRRDAGGVFGEARVALTTTRASRDLHAAMLRTQYPRSCASFSAKHR
jgi:hypothetical protein